MRSRLLVLVSVAQVLFTGLAAETIVLWDRGTALDEIRRIPLPGVETDGIEVSPDGLVLRFRKPGPERRLLAVEVPVTNGLPSVRALEMVCSFDGEPELKALPTILFLERSGGGWYQAALPMQPGTRSATVRASLEAPKEAAFSRDPSGHLDWESVARVWVGAAVDGAGAGSLTLGRIVLTDEPYRPTEPYDILERKAAAWRMSKDSAVTSTPLPAANGTTGFSFTVPGGRHVYFTPSQPVPPVELSAYAGVRLTYRATLPPGIPGLLVMLSERGGGQFYVTDHPPPASPEWKTVDIPFGRFQHGGWSRDENGRLDLPEVRTITVGAHGVPKGDGGEGRVELRALELLPPKPEQP